MDMLDSNMGFPYPVLRPEAIDYKTAVFGCEISVIPDEGGYEVRCNTVVGDPVIKRFVQEGKASIGVLVKCDSTWLRKVEKITEGDFQFKLSTSAVHNRVFLCPIITVNEKVEFTSDGFDEDFEGMTFVLHPGDPIAIGETRKFDAEYEDDLAKKGDSIIIVSSNPMAKDITIETDCPAITITVPDSIRKSYTSIQSNRWKYGVLAGLLYMPAIMQAVKELATKEDDVIGFTWAKTIRDSVMQIVGGDQSKYDSLMTEDNCYKVSQMLLGGMEKPMKDLAGWMLE